MHKKFVSGIVLVLAMSMALSGGAFAKSVKNFPESKAVYEASQHALPATRGDLIVDPSEEEETSGSIEDVIVDNVMDTIPDYIVETSTAPTRSLGTIDEGMDPEETDAFDIMSADAFDEEPVLELVPDDVAVSVDADHPTITVYGTAEHSVSPDEAVLTFAVTELGTMPKAKIKADIRVSHILEALSLAKIPAHLAGWEVYPSYDPEEGSYATATIVTDAIDVDMVDAAINAAFGAGADSLRDVSYRCSNYALEYDHCLVDAIRAAYAKADLMASASGKLLGDLVSIAEITDDTSYAFSGSLFFDGMAGVQAGAVMTEPEDLVVNAVISVTYELLSSEKDIHVMTK